MRLINPRTYKGGGLDATPLPVRFSEFSLRGYNIST